MRRLPGLVLMVYAVSAAAAYGHDRGDSPRNGSVPARPGIYKLEELKWPQFDALNRQRTLFILPAGMLEEHGPHLPVGADTIGVMYEAAGVSRRLTQALPEWNIVMMPPLNYGSGGANVLGGMFVHPGTYAIRQSTLRSIVADIGGQIAQNGFKSRGTRVTAEHLSPSEVASFGMDVHAGVSETSGMLAVRRDLVRSNYKTLPSRAGRSLSELREVASAPGWQGYLSSPAKANARYGRAVEAWWVAGFSDLILRAVGGENLIGHSRTPDSLPDDPGVREVLGRSLDNERAFAQQLQDWLAWRARER